MDRAALQEHLAQAQRHAAQGEIHITRQESIIADLDHNGQDTAKAREVLATLRDAQLNHEQDVERLLKELQQ